MKKYILLLALALVSICNHSAERFNFKSLDVKDGIPDNYVYAILQDSYGFMWFVSGGGLNRYDPVSETIFPNTMTSAPKISIRLL